MALFYASAVPRRMISWAAAKGIHWPSPPTKMVPRSLAKWKSVSSRSIFFEIMRVVQSSHQRGQHLSFPWKRRSNSCQIVAKADIDGITLYLPEKQL